MTYTQAQTNSLLGQYKDIIDDSLIMSKTDLHGTIIYANEQFCKISGYKLQDLIGKSHNIVRHPDVDKSIFKDLWKTIKSGQKWRGVVKNLSANGKTYWVKAVIHPILDLNGNISEYIAVRDDITEMMEFKERLQQKLNLVSENLAEIFNLNQDYEKAIEESNIVFRINLSGNIIYANNSFFALTGYSAIDVLGKSYNLLNIDQSVQDIISNSIANGDIYKGIISLQAKNGQYLWLNITLTPIKDQNAIPREYIAICNDITKLIELQDNIEKTHIDILSKLGQISEQRDGETGDHIKRVALYSQALAALIGLSKKDCELIYISSQMHDIGKIAIPDSILLKKGKLCENEYDIMRNHAQIGYDILKNSASEILKHAAIIALQHHEKYDGSGYPNKLAGDEIHIFGRITAIADVFDALICDRPYKKAWQPNDVFSFFENQKNIHFDGDIVDVFLQNKNIFLDLKSAYYA